MGRPVFFAVCPDWFLTQEQVKLWRDYDDYYDDDKLIKRQDYKKLTTQKPKIEEELMPVAWHPSRGREKRVRKIVEVTDSCFKII